MTSVCAAAFSLAVNLFPSGRHAALRAEAQEVTSIQSCKKELTMKMDEDGASADWKL